MTWILYIALGCSGIGCNTVQEIAYQTKADCFEAVDRFVAIRKVEKDDKIFCRPAKVVEK